LTNNDNRGMVRAVLYIEGWDMTKALAALAIVGLALAGPASAQKMPKTATPKIFEDVIQCRAITDEAARLACYDRGVAALQTAQQSNDLYVADKEAMKEARRGLFGFSIPKLKIFGDDDLGAVDEIETTIAGVRDGQRGLVFTLADGARWAQMDKKYMDRPKIGSKIKIEKAALGSYMASVNGRSGFRIERLND
jgi:hypothetical protein